MSADDVSDRRVHPDNADGPDEIRDLAFAQMMEREELAPFARAVTVAFGAEARAEDRPPLSEEQMRRQAWRHPRFRFVMSDADGDTFTANRRGRHILIRQGGVSVALQRDWAETFIAYLQTQVDIIKGETE